MGFVRVAAEADEVFLVSIQCRSFPFIDMSQNDANIRLRVPFLSVFRFSRRYILSSLLYINEWS